ncbi:MAG: ATP-binding protein [Methylococcales bacterium]
MTVKLKETIQADILRLEKTKILYNSLWASVIISLLLAFILVGIQVVAIPARNLYIWLTCISIILLARGGLAIAWQRSRRRGKDSADPWLLLFRIGVILTGLAWGVGSILCFPPGNVPHQVFLAYILSGLGAGAITSLSTDRVSTICYLIPTLTPLIVCFGREGNDISIAMSITVVFYLFFVAMNAERVGRNFHENICMRIQANMREQVLRKSEASLKQAQSVANMGSYELNLGSGELQCSEEYLRLWAIEPTGSVPSAEYFKQCINPEDSPRVEQLLKQAIEQHETFDCTYRIKWPDGQERQMQNRAELIFDKTGQAIQLIGTVQDVTESKKIQAALLAAKEAAESASRAKSEFLASMSHELRTPLNSILGFSQLFGMDPNLPDHAKGHAHEIERAGHHLLSLINDLIDLARIEAGKLELSLEPVSLRSVIKDSLAIVMPIARKQGIQIIDCEDEGHDATVCADYNRLRQVIINLVSNAIKYNRPQGAVRLTYQLREARVRISVSDNGPGIPVDKHERIFNAFDRLGAERGEIEGSGIGLVITKRIVAAMAGIINFESVEGQGSTFWVEFPIVECAEQTVLAAHKHQVFSTPSLQSSNPVVLYVEDNPMNQRLMQQIFAMRKDLQLLIAHSAELGIEMALASPPALILMDINLPGLDGYQALARLKAEQATKNVPVVAVSANAMKGDASRGLAAGFAGYITKPINLPELFEVLNTTIEQQQANVYG